MRPHSQLSASGGFSHHKSVYHLSMGELLAAQKMDKSSRMGMAPTRTIEEGGTEDIRRLMKSCVDGVLDLSAGEGLSEDGFASLIWGLNDVTENDVCPIKTVIFQCREHLSAQQRESLVAVMGLVVEFSDAQASGHAVPALPLEEPADTPPGAPLNAPMNAPMTSPMTSPMNSPLNGPSVSTDPGPQDSPAARYWSTLLKECREKFSADACAQGSPEALSKTKASVQEAVASRCSGDGVPPTLDLSGENIDTVAIWVIEAALAHWLMPIQTLRLGPLGGLDAEQRVSLLLTCLDSESLKENAGCLDLKACAGPRSSGAPDEAGQSAAWVFSPADLAAYQKVGTGEKQVSLELDPAVIAPDALPGLRELVDAGRPIKGLPPVRAEPELQTPAQPTHQGPRAPSVDELLQRNADFRQLYEQVRGRLAQADGDTIAQWLEGCRMPPQEWAALKSLARTVAGHAQILAYEIPARPVKTEKKQRLSEGLFDERFGRFRQLLGGGHWVEALALFENVVLTQDQMEVLRRYASAVQKAADLISDRDVGAQTVATTQRPSAQGAQQGLSPLTGFSDKFKRDLWVYLAGGASEVQMLFEEAVLSPEQIAQLDEVATQLIALGAASPDAAQGGAVSDKDFLLIQGQFQQQVKNVNLQPAHGWLKDQQGEYRPLTLAQWRALRDDWPEGRENTMEWERRAKVLAHLAQFEPSEAKSRREAAVRQHMNGLLSAGMAFDLPRLAALCQDQPPWAPNDRLTLEDRRRDCARRGRVLREQLKLLKQQPVH